MKIERLKLANSVKVGNREVVFCENKEYDNELLEDGLIIIRRRDGGGQSFTSIYNTVYFTQRPEIKKPANKTVKKKVAKSGNKRVL